MIYNKIEYLLRKKNRTQKDLIFYLKMSRQGFYTMIENKTMKVSVLEKMSEFFNVPISYWFEEKDIKANYVEEEKSNYGLPKKSEMKQLEKDLEYFRERLIKLEKENELLKNIAENH